MDGMDLNTKMANYCVSCKGRADQHRRQADTARSQDDGGDGMAREINETEARKHKTLAGRWDVRAQHAEKGVFAVHDDHEGVQHQFEHRELKDEADAAYRSVYLDKNNAALDHNQAV
jgi:hypothetical protein